LVRKLIGWALENPLIVVLLALTIAALGVFSFIHINVEAYPDPAPPTVEVIAQFPGASAEEVEKQVTIPLEVTLSGMPGAVTMHSKSVFGLSDIHVLFEYGHEYEAARQETINRLQSTQPLPTGVTPQISPESPTGEIYRYTLRSPKDAAGHDIYTPNDLKALQDWVLEREFRTVPRIVDITSFGGTVKRYEIQPDPNRMRRYGITLAQLSSAISNSNFTVGADYLNQGDIALTVRSVGLFGGGEDPVRKVLGMNDPLAAAKILRAEEDRRIRDIRALVITSVNNQPVRVEDIAEGGRVGSGEAVGERGVIVSHQTRLGMIGQFEPDDDQLARFRADHSLSVSQVGHDEPEKVECIVLLRKGEDTLPALKDVEAKVKELNDPLYGRMLPGVLIEPYYDRTDLVHITTETVTENLLVGITLVCLILFMFLNNVRTAIIVAVNIPLALLFAFSMLYLRGKSANLLSIGAVDFGIIVDSSVIMAENIYRHLASGENSHLPLKTRILEASSEIDRALLFSTLIMVCAFIPLFTMQGPEGALFGPMAQTYAFSLGGALFLATTLTPVLCMLCFKNFEPVRDNFLVRFMKQRYLWQLQVCLHHRWPTVIFFGVLIAGTVAVAPFLGREFMPELEEGNLWIRGTAAPNITLARQAADSKEARAIMAGYPEVEQVVNEIGRPDDGTDTDGYYNSEFFVPLRPQKDWPSVVERKGWARWLFGAKRTRTKAELVTAINADLGRKLPGIDWNFSQNIRDNVMEALSGIKGDNSLKIVGPDLDKLQSLGTKARNIVQDVLGMEDIGVFNIRGQSHLAMRPDPEKCQQWGVQVADVNNVAATALGGKAMTEMIEGEKIFDVTVRWPARLRSSESSILDIPVDLGNNQVVQPQGPGFVPSAQGTSVMIPSKVGTQANTANPLSNTPRLRLRNLVSPVGDDGTIDRSGQFERPGAAVIYREQGKRLIAVKFSIRGRDLGGAVKEAQDKTRKLFEPPYHPVWAGEFEEMEGAEGRLLFIIPLSLGLILILLYSAFRSFMDAIVVLSNVFALAIGGVWALYLTGTSFSISAAVGFVSLFGVAIMDGLLMISYFNALRQQGLPLEDAILEGAAKRVRPVMMTALTALLGLLPAALSTQIGSQTQKPLAIVVVGGMATTLLLTRYLMPVLYSFYGHREPPAVSTSMAH
jgi:heavy metal efflux system protein